MCGAEVVADHAALAARALTQVVAGEALVEIEPVTVFGRKLETSGAFGLEKTACDLELRRGVARGHEAVVADLHEARRQDVKEEPFEELVVRERDLAAVLGREGDRLVGDLAKPVVRDPDAVGIAAEILVDVLCAVEGSLRVDVPLVSIEAVLESVEDAPLECVVQGAGLCLESFDRLKRLFTEDDYLLTFVARV